MIRRFASLLLVLLLGAQLHASSRELEVVSGRVMSTTQQARQRGFHLLASGSLAQPSMALRDARGLLSRRPLGGVSFLVRSLDRQASNGLPLYEVLALLPSRDLAGFQSPYVTETAAAAGRNRGIWGRVQPPPAKSLTPPVDVDGDGIADAFEARNGLSIGTNDARLDDDGDGHSNLDEAILGTSPKDPRSGFRSTLSPRLGAIPGLKLGWQGRAGRAYQIFTRPSLFEPWQPLGDPMQFSSDGPFEFILPMPTGNLFYKIEVTAPPLPGG